MDHTLFLKAKDGDKKSISLLITALDPTLAKFASKLCATSEDAEDSIQHARIVISQKLGSFQELAKFSTWLFAIIKNECYRLQKKMFGFSIHGPSEFNWSDSSDLERQIEMKLMLERVSIIMAQLDSESREVILLKDVEGLTLEEISLQIKQTVPAVKSRLHRGRMQIKEQLGQIQFEKF